jgi:anti-sigma factor RsiW
VKHDEAMWLLDPYLDGALDAERRWAVAAHAAECPLCSAVVAERARLRATVRSQLRDVPTPAGLSERIHANIARAGSAGTIRASRRPHRLVLLFPAIAALALLVVGVWWVARATDEPRGSALDLSVQLAANHALFANDESLLEVSGPPTAIASWFGDKIAFPVTLPEVPGYELQGARLVAVDGKPAALVVYENEAARRYVSLLTFTAPVDDLVGLTQSGNFTTATQADIAVAIWSDGDLHHALMASASQDEVLQLATSIAGRS